MIAAVDVNSLDETMEVAISIVSIEYTDTTAVAGYIAQVTDGSI